MDIEITPRSLKGSVCAPFSKSDAHRVLIAAALSKESTEITLSCEPEDIRATIRCLEALGARLVVLDAAEMRFCMEPIGMHDTLVESISTHDAPSRPVLDCGESGTTLRLLIPVVAALGRAVRFTAGGRLPERPLTELTSALTKGGIRFSALTLPFTLEGSLKPGEYQLPGNISSQYISGLLYALPLLEGDSCITLTTKLESASYVEMTLSTLRAFGIDSIVERDDGYYVGGGQSYVSPGSAVVEGDWSNAAFLLAAGALGGPVMVSGLSSASLQGDRAMLGLLHSFGAHVQTNDEGVQVSAKDSQARDIDVSEVPDLFPILAVVASTAHGTTRLFNAARLRMKESDRIHAVATMLGGLGADVQELPDALVIQGKPRLAGGIVDGMSDHRIVMAASVASILCEHPVTILGAEAVNKSYPHFFDDFIAMGGSIRVINNR